MTVSIVYVVQHVVVSQVLKNEIIIKKSSAERVFAVAKMTFQILYCTVCLLNVCICLRKREEGRLPPRLLKCSKHLFVSASVTRDTKTRAYTVLLSDGVWWTVAHPVVDFHVNSPLRGRTR